MSPGAVTIDTLIDAAGLVADVGGTATVAYVNPTNHTALMKEKDGNSARCLTPDYSGRTVEHDLRPEHLGHQGHRG